MVTRFLPTFLPLLFAVLVTATALVYLNATPRTSHQSGINQTDEVLYLPNGEALSFMSFGYRNALARILWFNTINYFGKHYGTDKNYRWLFHMCNLVTDLDPRATHVYEFGAIMLSWEVNAPEEAIKLLTKAIQNFPNDWKYYYLRGFTSMFFLERNTEAQADFARGALLPGAHSIMARLAARVASKSQNREEAIRLLRELLETTTDPQAHGVIQKRLRALERSVEVQ
jgi:tetratricopeptide (TPR) repeat protein